MNVLLVNKFLYPRGGDSISTLNTGKLLISKGHRVIFWGMNHHFNSEYPYEDYFVSNVNYNKPIGSFKQLKVSFNILYSFEAKEKIKRLIEIERPEVVHLNNFAHQISPSILDVFKKYKIPTVMTMHDYKLVCPSYSLLLNGKPCEMCRNGRYYRCFIKKCTKDSYTKSLINTVEMYLHHKILHIYGKVDIFISPSKFLKEKVADMGFKREVIWLSNFVCLEEFMPDYRRQDESLVYFGRLSYEKGLFTLLEAMKNLNIKLKIIGDGPIRKSLEFRVQSSELKNINFLGYMSGKELKNEIKNSMAVVLPSECYENNPITVLEAFALGKPVIGSRIGGIPELVKNNETGLTFEPGDIDDLKGKIEYLIKNPDLAVEMGGNARKFVEENFNPQKHYQELMKIYQMAIDMHKRKL